MQSDTWVTLLQKFPPAYHDNLVVVTSMGLEISLQAVLRLEDHYLVVRGRLGGTTDTGRIFFIPYDQINLLCVQKPLQAAEVRMLYGEPPDEADVEELMLAELAPAAEGEGVDKALSLPELAPPPTDEPPKPARPPRLSKSELLARIRSRSQGLSANGPPADQ